MDKKEAKLICQLDAMVKLHEKAAIERDAIIKLLRETIESHKRQNEIQERLIAEEKKRGDRFQIIAIKQGELIKDLKKFCEN